MQDVSRPCRMGPNLHTSCHCLVGEVGWWVADAFTPIFINHFGPTVGKMTAAE